MPGLQRKQVNELWGAEARSLQSSQGSSVLSPRPGPGKQGCLEEGDTGQCVCLCVCVHSTPPPSRPPRTTVTSPSASSASSSSLALAPDASISSSSAAGGKAVSSLAAAGVFFFFLRAFLSFSWDRRVGGHGWGHLCLRPGPGCEFGCTAVWVGSLPTQPVAVAMQARAIFTIDAS